MKNMHLEGIIGQTFSTSNDPNTEYKCVGYAQNETFIVFGALNDTVNNRFTVVSKKLTEVRFKGQA
jgi:hypothetical protein